MTATYSGGWVFGKYTYATLAAFKFDQWYNRWEGNLHFPDGTCRVYLEVNAQAGLKKNSPVLHIKSVQGDVVIGFMMRLSGEGREWFYGRINTPQPLAIEGHVTPSGTRFVLYAKDRPLSRTYDKRAITVYLAPYPAGEAWKPKLKRVREDA